MPPLFKFASASHFAGGPDGRCIRNLAFRGNGDLQLFLVQKVRLMLLRVCD